MLLFFCFVCVLCFVLMLFCKGPVQLVIGICFSWKKKIESCMNLVNLMNQVNLVCYPGGTVQRKHTFMKMEEKSIKTAQAFVFHNLERKWL